MKESARAQAHNIYHVLNSQVFFFLFCLFFVTHKPLCSDPEKTASALCRYMDNTSFH